MLSVVTDPDLEVFQVTTDLEGAGNARGAFFSSDSSRFFFSRHWSAGGLSGTVEYTLCEVNDGFALRRLTDDADPRSPVLTPDDRFFYYFANPAEGEKDDVTLKRVDLTTFETEQICVFDKPVEGVGKRPKAVIPRVGSIRADGRMLLSGFNFETEGGEDHFAPVCIDLETLDIHGFDFTPWSWRVGGSYFPGTDPKYMKRVLMGRSGISQHWDKDGNYTSKEYGYSALHIVSEEGEILGTLPFGGDKEENMSHCCWRGANYEVLSHSGMFHSAPHWRGAILCAAPVECPPEHYPLGRHIPGAQRVELTRNFVRPDVCHICWHRDGIHGVCDTEGWEGRGTPCLQGPAAFLYLATVVENGDEDPYIITKYLLHPRSSWNGAFTENCQVLSPDLNTVIFNSDWTGKHGQPQVFAARGFSFPSVD